MNSNISDSIKRRVDAFFDTLITYPADAKLKIIDMLSRKVKANLAASYCKSLGWSKDLADLYVDFLNSTTKNGAAKIGVDQDESNVVNINQIMGLFFDDVADNLSFNKKFDLLKAVGDWFKRGRRL